MIVHRLDGCAPTPLAHYLKAMGILRLVSEQADSEARGWWDGDYFRIATRLDRKELISFFLSKYSPTPLVAPWNKGSGFYYENDPALALIESSLAPRYESLRAGIKAARLQLDKIGLADASVREVKTESKRKDLTNRQRTDLRSSPEYKRRLAEAEQNFKSLKVGLIPALRLEWRGPHREWMDSALVLDSEGAARFPALLGTGGNDGRLDFTYNYFQRLAEIFDLSDSAGSSRDQACEWFEEALFGSPARVHTKGLAVGQFAPGNAGGANAANGPDASSQLNPVNFVLMLEGTLLFKSAATRRLDARHASRVAAPFAISGQGAGYASASESDESARGEQWMPLWSQPATLREITNLLTAGRAQVGARTANEPLDFARAAARLGVARGVVAFQRYGYIERNGQSNLAVPLGRFTVADRVTSSIACLDDIESWSTRLRREARSRGTPVRLSNAERRLADALFGVTQHPDEPARWQSVLLRLADVEGVQVSGTGFRVGPVPRLRPEWVAAADDDSAEFRLALSCALQAGRHRQGVALDGVRRHWLPMDGSRFAMSGTGSQARLQIGADLVMKGRDGIIDAMAMLQRRLVEAEQHGTRRLPLVATYGAAASSADLESFLNGQVDADRTMHLARALMTLDPYAWAKSPSATRRALGKEMPDDAWVAIRLALLPWPLPDGRSVGADPSILRRLASGDAAAAVDTASRRLHAAGIKTTVRAASVSPDAARRWAAALAFPITRRTAALFAKRLDPSSSTKETAA